MGRLLSYDGYTRADLAVDECGVHSGIAEVVQLALDLDDEGLADCELADLEDAAVALSYCDRHGCDNHAGQRSAHDALLHAQLVTMQRLADLDQEEADARGPECCNGANCSRCVGG